MTGGPGTARARRRMHRDRRHRAATAWLAAMLLGVAGPIGAVLSPLPALAQAQTASRLDDIIAAGRLRVATTGDYRPFTWLDPASGRFSGLDIELAENLAQALGAHVVFVHTSWPTLMRDFEAQTFDIAMGGISVTLERQRKAWFSAPYLRDGKTPIARCENREKFATLDQIDRAGVRVIVNPGGTNERFARNHFGAADVRIHGDNTTIFDEIASGRADVMVTDASEARYQQMLRPELCALHPDHPFDFAEKAYLLPRDPALKAFVDQWLHIAMESGAFSAIAERWLK